MLASEKTPDPESSDLPIKPSEPANLATAKSGKPSKTQPSAKPYFKVHSRLTGDSFVKCFGLSERNFQAICKQEKMQVDEETQKRASEW